MSTLPVPSSAAGPPGPPSRCTSCAAALAPDQLFCLACGTRRRDARIPFRDVLATEAAPVVAMASGGGGTPGGDQGRLQPGAGSYLPFIAMLATLLLALAVGAWIGRGQQSPVAAAAPLAAAPLTAVAASTPPDAAPTTSEAAATDSGDAADDEKAAAEAKPAASSAEVKKLDALSPEEYQKQATKLPKEVGTGGEAPATDDKPAGGGTGFEEFE